MRVQTVLGPISPYDLGITLTHEHFSLDFENFYVEPPKVIEDQFKKKITLQNVGYLRQYPYGSHYNVKFYDDDTHDAVMDEIIQFKKFGGGTIVENTTHGLKRNLGLLYDISKKSGVHVIAGTGYYLDSVQEDTARAMTVEQMTDVYTKEILFGLDVAKNHIHCGFIGEVGSTWPITDFEKNAIRATGEVQSAIGCGVSFHPGRNSKAPAEIVRIYLEAGGKADKCVMSHLDRTIFDDTELLEFADFGTYCQFDLFGTECSFYQLNPAVDMPSDAQRIDKIIKLIDNGNQNRVLMSHDIHTKHRLCAFGGHGFSHIINNIIPKMMLKGILQDVIDEITTKNPANWLQFNI